MAVATALAMGVAVVALAHVAPYASTCLRSAVADESDCPGFPALTVDFAGQVAPKELPSHEMAPVAVQLDLKVTSSIHPSALREATLDFRNLMLDARGLPSCHPFVRHRLVGDLRTRCAGAVVGGGRADFEVAFPERAPLLARSRLTVYNGGGSTLYVVGLARAPLQHAILIPVEIVRMGGEGTHTVAKIPRIAGGDGSLIDLSLRLKRLFPYKGERKSFATAKCPDDRIATVGDFSFRNEARVAGVPATTSTKGKIAIPCSAPES